MLISIASGNYTTNLFPDWWALVFFAAPLEDHHGSFLRMVTGIFTKISWESVNNM